MRILPEHRGELLVNLVCIPSEAAGRPATATASLQEPVSLPAQPESIRRPCALDVRAKHRRLVRLLLGLNRIVGGSLLHHLLFLDNLLLEGGGGGGGGGGVTVFIITISCLFTRGAALLPEKTWLRTTTTTATITMPPIAKPNRFRPLRLSSYSKTSEWLTVCFPPSFAVCRLGRQADLGDSQSSHHVYDVRGGLVLGRAVTPDHDRKIGRLGPTADSGAAQAPAALRERCPGTPCPRC